MAEARQESPEPRSEGPAGGGASKRTLSYLTPSQCESLKWCDGDC